MASQNNKLDWIDALKGFAIIGILLNHFVESYFHSYPWFSNPESNWPELAERMGTIFPKEGSFFIRFIQFLGWLGDMGPGIFIFISGLTLTLSALKKPINTIEFYKNRLLRIYPLYIAIHAIILFVAAIFFKWEIHYLSPYTILSFLGLRFTDSLFFYLNPSWWFIWFILQMYFLFPFLLNLLKIKGINYFLTITLTITVLSRLSGIGGYTFTGDLYNWMTGMFGATRLFEFALGMYFGFSIFYNNDKITALLNKKKKLFFLSLIIYVFGFISSWTYVGSIISNILVTIGLSGIFYCIYYIVFRNHKTLNFSILWIGRNSFSAFLLHQPFLIYFSSALNGYSKVIVLSLTIIGSFIAGNAIEKLVNIMMNLIQKNFERIKRFFTSFYGYYIVIACISATTILSFLIAGGAIRISKFFTVLFLFQILYLILYRIIVRIKFSDLIFRLIDLTIFLSVFVILLPANWLPLFWLYIIFIFSLLLLSRKIRYSVTISTSIILVFIVTYAGELFLKRNFPLELDKWGEFPALQIDNETVYSLIPNKTTHLKYNNYDYFVHTNSQGFASPEINLAIKPANEKRILIIGDAFSMPEGMEYENSYPALLEKKLRINYPEYLINIINAGVTGYGPNEEYAQLNKYIELIKPDITINQLFINEFEEINYTNKIRREDIGFKNEKSKRVEYFGHAQLPAHITTFLKNLFGNNEEFNYYKSLLNLYEKKSPFYSDTVRIKMDQYLQHMKELCFIKKTEYIVLSVPGQIEISDPKYISYFPNLVNLKDTSIFDFNIPFQIYDHLCMKNGIKYVETKSFLKNHPIQPLYFEDSWHWNKDGHKAIAGYLFDYLIENKLISKIQKK